MKILYVSIEYPIPPPSGGIASVLQDLSREWVRQSHDVKIICVDDQFSRISPVHIIEDQGVEVHYIASAYIKNLKRLLYSSHIRTFARWPLPDLSLLSIPATAFFYWRQLKKTWIPDIIQAHDWRAPGLLFPVFEPKIPFVMRGDGHCKVIMSTKGHTWTPYLEAQHRLERFCARHASLIMPCSQFLADDQIRDFEVNPDKAVVIYNCVTIDDCDGEGIDRGSKPADGVKIVFAGRLELRKGIDLLLEAGSQLHRKYPNTKYYLIGRDDINIKSYLEKRRFEKAFLNNVVIMEQIPRREVKKIMRQCDFAVFPSRYEPLGIVAMEAMACGIPVVVSDAGGWREVVKNEVHGVIVKADDVDSLRVAMGKMILYGSEKRCEMGAKAKQMIEKEYSPQTIADQMLNIYDRLVNRFPSMRVNPS
jgi:glycosyltransferase involved in cell wall biosynthesis